MLVLQIQFSEFGKVLVTGGDGVFIPAMSDFVLATLTLDLSNSDAESICLSSPEFLPPDDFNLYQTSLICPGFSFPPPPFSPPPVQPSPLPPPPSPPPPPLPSDLSMGKHFLFVYLDSR